MRLVNDAPIIELRAVSRIRDEAGVIARVDGVSLAVHAGDVVALTGEPGCGKNLILRLLGMLETPDQGEVFVDGEPTAQLTDDARIELRNRRCGYLFAAPFLLSAFNAAENVAMPIFKISQLSPVEARDRTEALLRFVGLDSTASHLQLPSRLQHRVALARALANLPAAIFVEDLDLLLEPEDLPEFRRLLHAASKVWGVAIIATAQPSLAPVDGERRLEIADGRVVCEVEG
jgi:lipoprotein-releasing system ATP-binding protein